MSNYNNKMLVIWRTAEHVRYRDNFIFEITENVTQVIF